MIEKYWLDGILYYVEFIVKDGRTITKEVILPTGIDEEVAKKMILNRFNNIQDIKTLDFMSEVLLMRGFEDTP